jgi:hypothetical protein
MEKIVTSKQNQNPTNLSKSNIFVSSMKSTPSAAQIFSVKLRLYPSSSEPLLDRHPIDLASLVFGGVVCAKALTHLHSFMEWPFEASLHGLYHRVVVLDVFHDNQYCLSLVLPR